MIANFPEFDSVFRRQVPNDVGPAQYLMDTRRIEPFEGNPAAVCFLDAPPEADWMQAVAPR